MRKTDIQPTDFKVEPANQGAGHICAGCWFYENDIYCATAELTPFINSIFKQYPGNKSGTCKGLIAQYEPIKTTKWHEKEKVCTP